MTSRQVLDCTVSLTTGVARSVRDRAAVTTRKEMTVFVLTLAQTKFLAELVRIDVRGPRRIPSVGDGFLLRCGLPFGMHLGLSLKGRGLRGPDGA